MTNTELKPAIGTTLGNMLSKEDADAIEEILFAHVGKSGEECINSLTEYIVEHEVTKGYDITDELLVYNCMANYIKAIDEKAQELNTIGE